MDTVDHRAGAAARLKHASNWPEVRMVRVRVVRVRVVRVRVVRVRVRVRVVNRLVL